MDAATQPLENLMALGSSLAANWSFAWDALWTGGIAASILALVVATLSRAPRMRPATRHALWAAVVVSFATPLVSAMLGRPAWFDVGALVTAPPVVETPRLETPHWAQAPASRAPEVSLPRSTSDVPVATSTVERTIAPVDEEACEAKSPTTSLAAPPPVERPRIASHAPPAPSTETRAEPAPAAIPVATPAAPFIDTRLWIIRALAVRDAIADLPPLPLALWLAGALALAALQTIRIVALRRVVRAAELAPHAVRREVAEACRAIDLLVEPETRMTIARVSPLVWCGVRPCLLLPIDLWATLDAPSRRAILVHELAHIRRGDHRLCWIDSIIGIAYWWHPIAWWARHRLREAAEASCDAWVTSLCPSSRRKYAEALVLTTTFVRSSNHVGIGSVGVGFVSGRTRKLARRITMVMTHRNAPRMSIVGVGAFLLAVGLGAFVTPSLACPPCKEDQAKADGKVQVELERAAQGRNPVKVRTTVAPKSNQAASPFLGEAPALEAMTGHPGAQGRGALSGTVSGNSFTLKHGDLAVVAPRAWTTEASTEGTEARTYALPQGKLEAFVELMSRQDVPIFIENHGDSILIHATPQQHKVFGAFIKLIHPDGKSQAGAHPVSVEAYAAAAKEYDHALRVTKAMTELALTESKAKAKGKNKIARTHAKAAQEEALTAQQQLQDLNRSRRDIEKEIEKLRESAEKARERAEQLRESLEQLESQRGQAQDEAVEKALMGAVRSVEARVRTVEAEADAATSRLESRAAQLDSLAMLIDQYEVRLEAISDQLESMGDLAELEEIDAMANSEGEGEAAEAEEAEEAEVPTTPAPPTAPTPSASIHSYLSYAKAVAPTPSATPVPTPLSVPAVRRYLQPVTTPAPTPASIPMVDHYRFVSPTVPAMPATPVGPVTPVAPARPSAPATR